MPLPRQLSNIFLLLYKNINRTGLLNCKWMQAVFVLSYFTYKKYLEDSIAKLTKNFPALFHNGHILDIGANIGYTSCVFSKVLTSNYKIFSFEPEKRNIHILKKVAQTYHFADKLVITAAAVGEKEGEIEIWQNDGHHADHRVLTDKFRTQMKSTFQSQKIPLVTVDHFLKTQMATHPISFIKIDVQGYELAVCRGMEATLAANPHCVVLFEYSPSLIETLGYSAEALIQFFQDKNYFFYILDRNGALVPLNPKDIRLDNYSNGYCDILCSRKKIMSQTQ